MAWLTGWDKRIKITISETNIDATLANFPLLVYLSVASGISDDDVTAIFDEIGANSKKIAVTTSDETTECYVEIEKWDSANEKVWLWVKIPSISGTADTDLYIYYDNDHADNDTYVGVVGSTPGKTVWDANFVAVYHMHDLTTSTIADSTGVNNGTKKDANEPVEVTTGIIGNAQDHDGTNDNINCGHNASLNLSTAITYEVWENHDNNTAHMAIIGKDDLTTRLSHIWVLTSNRIEFGLWDSGVEVDAYVGNNVVSTGAWNYVVGTYDGTTMNRYVNGSVLGSSVAFTSPFDSNANEDMLISLGATYPFNGRIDEVRVSKIARTVEWIKATYHSGNDNLLTFGDEELVVSNLTIHMSECEVRI